MRDNLLRNIANDESLTKKERIDRLCRIDTFNHTDLGVDSSPSEVASIKIEQKLIDELIKELEK